MYKEIHFTHYFDGEHDIPALLRDNLWGVSRAIDSKSWVAGVTMDKDGGDYADNDELIKKAWKSFIEKNYPFEFKLMSDEPANILFIQFKDKDRQKVKQTISPRLMVLADSLISSAQYSGDDNREDYMPDTVLTLSNIAELLELPNTAEYIRDALKKFQDQP